LGWVVKRQLRVVCIQKGSHAQASMHVCLDILQDILVAWPKTKPPASSAC
jgi:hypothetical protein